MARAVEGGIHLGIADEDSVRHLKSVEFLQGEFEVVGVEFD